MEKALLSKFHRLSLLLHATKHLPQDVCLRHYKFKVGATYSSANQAPCLNVTTLFLCLPSNTLCPGGKTACSGLFSSRWHWNWGVLGGMVSSCTHLMKDLLFFIAFPIEKKNTKHQHDFMRSSGYLGIRRSKALGRQRY